jgi:response regulator of citrate/malate metabolism
MYKADENLWLLVDDIKTYTSATIARTPQEAKEELRKKVWSHLILDDCLFANLTGRDILKWAIENQLLPAHVVLGAMVAYAKQNMGEQLKAAGYISSGNDSWFCQKLMKSTNAT